MTDEREYWRSAIVGRIDEQQPIYASELLDEIVGLRAQLAEANERIEALELALEQRWNQWQTAEGRAEAADKRIEALEAEQMEGIK